MKVRPWIATSCVTGALAGSLGLMIWNFQVHSAIVLSAFAVAFGLTLLVSFFADHMQQQVGISAAAGAFTIIFMALFFLFDLGWFERTLLPPALFGFSIMILTQFSTLSDEDRNGRALMASVGVAVILVVGTGVWISGLLLDTQSTWWFFAVMLGMCALVLGIMSLRHLRMGSVYEVPRPAVQDIFRDLSSLGTQKDMVYFTFASTSIVTALVILAVGNYQYAAAHFDQSNWDTITWLFLFAAPLGSVFAIAPLRELGARRSFVWVVLLWFGFVLAGLFATHEWERALLHICYVFVLGMMLAVSAAFQAAITPSEKPAQLASVFAFCISLGCIVGWLVAQHLEIEWAVTWAVISATVGLYALQITGYTTITPSGNQDWESHQELGRHTAFSRFSQALARIAMELFFGKVHVVGWDRLTKHEHVILVSNHPNTFLDPLLITALVPGRLHYLAKSTIWRIPLLGSILDRMGAIPVHRRQDHPDMTVSANDHMFDSAVEKLVKGAQILVFPEGVSQSGLSLKPIKTGTVRLALKALAHPKWHGPIAIIPVGLDYEEPALFRSSVSIRIGEPILLKRDQANEEKVRNLTDTISQRMCQLIPHLETTELEDLVHQVEDLYGAHLTSVMGFEDPQEARLRITEAINHYHRLDPETVCLFRSRILAYSRQATDLATPANHPPIPFLALLSSFWMLVSPTMIGLMLNWVPYRVTGIAVERLNADRVWRATAKLGLGTIVYALYYAAIGAVVAVLAGFLAAYLVVVFLVGTGLMALGAIDRYAFRIQQIATVWRAFWTQDTDDELAEMRIQLIQDLERFRESYAFYRENT